MTGCSTVQIDTMTECSMDLLIVLGAQVWSDVNCTDDTLEGIRRNQEDLIDAIRKDIELQDSEGTPSFQKE